MSDKKNQARDKKLGCTGLITQSLSTLGFIHDYTAKIRKL